MARSRQPVDGSHCPKTLKTTLTPEQELIVVELRTTLLLPTDDLLSVTPEFINPAVSRAGLGRCLRRHGLSDLRDLVKQNDGARATKKTFKDYGPASSISISSTCPRCRTNPPGAICSSPSIAPRAGYSSTSTLVGY